MESSEGSVKPKTRVTIRDMLLIMTIVAISLGWWNDRTRLELGNQYLQKELDLCRLRENAERVRRLSDPDLSDLPELK